MSELKAPVQLQSRNERLRPMRISIGRSLLGLADLASRQQKAVTGLGELNSTSVRTGAQAQLPQFARKVFSFQCEECGASTRRARILATHVNCIFVFEIIG
jgi:hypothetical protein